MISLSRVWFCLLALIGGWLSCGSTFAQNDLIQPKDIVRELIDNTPRDGSQFDSLYQNKRYFSKGLTQHLSKLLKAKGQLEQRAILAPPPPMGEGSLLAFFAEQPDIITAIRHAPAAVKVGAPFIEGSKATVPVTLSWTDNKISTARNRTDKYVFAQEAGQWRLVEAFYNVSEKTPESLSGRIKARIAVYEKYPGE